MNSTKFSTEIGNTDDNFSDNDDVLIIKNNFQDERKTWVQFLEDTRKKDQITELYNGLSSIKPSSNGGKIKLDKGFLHFASTDGGYEGENFYVWVEESAKYHMKLIIRGHTTCSLHEEIDYYPSENNKEALDGIFEAIGWNREDAYILFTILHNHIKVKEDRNMKAVDHFRSDFICHFSHCIPQWFCVLMKETYGFW